MFFLELRMQALKKYKCCGWQYLRIRMIHVIQEKLRK